MQRKRRKKKRFGVFLFLLVVCIVGNAAGKFQRGKE